MAILICGSCNGKVDDSLLRASKGDPEGAQRCPHCNRWQRPRPQVRGRLYLLLAVGFTAMFLLPALVPAGSPFEPWATVAGAAVFAVIAGAQWARQRRLVPSGGPDRPVNRS